MEEEDSEDADDDQDVERLSRQVVVSDMLQNLIFLSEKKKKHHPRGVYWCISYVPLISVGVVQW